MSQLPWCQLSYTALDFELCQRLLAWLPPAKDPYRVLEVAMPTADQALMTGALRDMRLALDERGYRSMREVASVNIFPGTLFFRPAEANADPQHIDQYFIALNMPLAGVVTPQESV